MATYYDQVNAIISALHADIRASWSVTDIQEDVTQDPAPVRPYAALSLLEIDEDNDIGTMTVAAQRLVFEVRYLGQYTDTETTPLAAKIILADALRKRLMRASVYASYGYMPRVLSTTFAPQVGDPAERPLEVSIVWQCYVDTLKVGVV